MADESRPHYFSSQPPVVPVAERVLPQWLFPTLGLVAALVVGLILYRGCALEPTRVVDSGVDDRATVNPWPRVLTDLRRQSDVAGCRVTLDRLATSLALNNTPGLQPASLDPARATELEKALALSEAEVNELRPASYSALDAYYLADCLYLREVARSLDALKAPPAGRAALAFALVNREVADRAWVRPDGQLMPPVPPTAVLNRGSGSAYERAVTFLALARQLGLDGCFVGPPGAAAQTWQAKIPPARVPGGPMWGVGVRAGPDIFVFDPARQKPFPAPGGKPATLAQLKADPSLLKPWRDAKELSWAVPDSDIAGAVVYPYVPLSALAPRMERLEQELRADSPPVQLYENWPKLVERFTAPGRAVAAWNPADPFTPVRSLSSYIPTKEGGYSPLPDLPTLVQVSMVPPSLLSGEGPVARIEFLRNGVLNRYAATFLAPPSPKERVTRGQFSEVVPDLVARLREFQAAQDRLRTDRNRDPAAVDDFLQELEAVMAKKRLARDKERDAPGFLTAEAAQEEQALIKNRANAVDTLTDLALADVGAAQATFLIALAMQEQAERAQARRELGAKGDAAAVATRAWAEASGWWSRYAPYQERQNQDFPGRGPLADRLRARAEKLAG